MLQNWPNTDVPNFQANVMSIYKCLSDLALRVLSVMAVGLGLVRKTKNNKSFHIFPYLCVFLLQLIIAWKLTLLKMALYVYQSIFISNFCIGHNVMKETTYLFPLTVWVIYAAILQACPSLWTHLTNKTPHSMDFYITEWPPI